VDHERRQLPGEGEDDEKGIVVTERTLRIVERLFPADQQAGIRKLLVEECGANLPFCETQDGAGLERVRFAVLMLSQGDLGTLRSLIDNAKTDWRDVLVRAGFGYSLTAHERWAQDVLEA
jgi:hypothetical protein